MRFFYFLKGVVAIHGEDVATVRVTIYDESVGNALVTTARVTIHGEGRDRNILFY